MSNLGKINLYAVIGLPVFAMLGALISFGGRADTLIFVFATNAIPMIIGGIVAGLLIRAVNNSGGSGAIALWPTVIPAAAGVLWYVYGFAALGSDAGREYFAGPFYLLGGTLIVAVIAAVAFFVTRGRSR